MSGLLLAILNKQCAFTTVLSRTALKSRQEHTRLIELEGKTNIMEKNSLVFCIPSGASLTHLHAFHFDVE